MCNALCRFGFDVTLLAGNTPRSKDVDVFEYYGLENTFTIITRKTGYHRGSTFFLSIRYYPILKRLARSNEDTLFYGRDVISLYILARSGRQVIYEVHDIFRNGPRKWAEEQLVKSQSLRKIVSISNELRKAYIEKYGGLLAGKKMIVAPDAADEQSNFSDVVSLDGGADFNACYIGGFHRGRGIEFILDVAERMPGVGFHFFGGTNKQIRRLKQKSPPNAHFYGYITPAQTYMARNAADVLLMPYQKEVMVSQNASETSQWMSPVKLFEYMSSRKPIVSSNHKVLREVLEHGRNSVLCESNNAGQWIQAIKSIQEDKKLRKDISETAYMDFVDKYTWDKRVRHVLAEHHAVLDE